MAEQDESNNKNNFPKKPIPGIYRFYIILLIFFIGLYFINSMQVAKKITWNKFRKDILENHEVKKIQVVNKERAEVFLTKKALNKPEHEDVSNVPIIGVKSPGPHYFFNIGSVETFEDKMDEAQKDFASEEQVSISYVSRISWTQDILPWLIPIALLIGFWYLMTRSMKGGGAGGNPFFNMGKNKAKVYDKEERPETKFDDVAGADQAKQEIQELVSFLKDRENYTDLGAKIPKGILLVGPPGTGKTLLGKAVAGEAEVPFFSLSGSDFVEMFVGVGASRVRNLFEEAKKKAPCIIFIDEIDAIGRARDRAKSMQSNDEQENTLNQLLQELDGFETNSGVIVLGATNRQDVLDKALLRPGRFDRQIHLDLPSIKEREDIFKIHVKPVKTDESVDLHTLAAQTVGFSGADIQNVCNEAALHAAREKSSNVTMEHFMSALDRIIGGLERTGMVIPENEKEIIAYHEAGHAVISKLLKHVDTLVKVSIVPRGRSLGANWYLPEEHHLNTQSQLKDKMAAMLAGRAAEDIIFGEISSGALDDLERVTKMAYTMISMYGFDEKVGHLSFHDSDGQWGNSFTKPYSEYLGEMIDKEVQELISNAYQRAKDLLQEKEELLNKLADKLKEKETIYHEDLEEVFKAAEVQ